MVCTSELQHPPQPPASSRNDHARTNVRSRRRIHVVQLRRGRSRDRCIAAGRVEHSGKTQEIAWAGPAATTHARGAPEACCRCIPACLLRAGVVVVSAKQYTHTCTHTAHTHKHTHTHTHTQTQTHTPMRLHTAHSVATRAKPTCDPTPHRTSAPTLALPLRARHLGHGRQCRLRRRSINLSLRATNRQFQQPPRRPRSPRQLAPAPHHHHSPETEHDLIVQRAADSHAQ
jgi:hypothetical protein